MAAPEYLYRYDGYISAEDVNEFDNPIFGTSGVHLFLHRFNVLRETRTGVWISIGFGHEKFVRLSANKQYACATPDQAWVSFQARKDRQIRILTNQLEGARRMLRATRSRAVPIGFDGIPDAALAASGHFEKKAAEPVDDSLEDL